jgi:hypothetical protein
MPQPTTRNKHRKRMTQRRRVDEHGVRGAYRLKSNRSAKQLRRTEASSRVLEMPEEQKRARGRAEAQPVAPKLAQAKPEEDYALAVSPTGTQQHQPQQHPMPRLARSRAKSPAIGRSKSIKTAKRRRANTGRQELRGTNSR